MWVGFLVSLLSLPAWICVLVRRMHDTNHGGVLAFILVVLMFLIPILAIIPILFFTIPRGTVGFNRFGPDPLLEPNIAQNTGDADFHSF